MKKMLPPKVFTCPFSILAVANLLAHNNISQICYCVQIPLYIYIQSAAVNFNFSFFENLTPFGGNIYFAGDNTCIHV